ncbi:MAG: ATP-binding protein [Alphaproteobacteria bacterium]|nr:ATP-binding protein [Alphaproteobacteria bacterium]
MPKSLFGRSLLIIVTPLVLLQVISAFIFYESHWDKVSRRLAANLAGDIGAVADLLSGGLKSMSLSELTDMAHAKMELDLVLLDGEILPNISPTKSQLRSNLFFDNALKERLSKPYFVDSVSQKKKIIVFVQLSDGILQVSTTRKRLFSSTTYVFVLWMVGSSLILFAVATIFMRNQVRPIRRLAGAAEAFGKGRDTPNFKPEGALEVRQAANAFIEMRHRIQRHISERTKMLAGVSHDLRTPLTRMKLQLAMLEEGQDIEDLKGDVADMGRMLDGYLAFARGEGGEKPVLSDLNKLLNEVVVRSKRKGGLIDLHTEGPITISLKPNAFERCVTNIIDNAIRYADHVSVRAGKRDEAIEITIDDDGPGIAEEERQQVFRPFYRIDDSRNQDTGGVGLGMSIARDIMQGHGGEIILGTSPTGGLRVRLRLPL